MKVIVRCAKNRVTKTEMEQIIESLFQENKDLRVHIGHLRDELNLSQQQSEARRQVICERDKLIQELNEQIQASEDELENTHCDLVNQKQLQEEMCDTIDDLRVKLARSESESSQGMSALVKFWEEAVKEKNKAEERAEEYRIALMESDCRVDECEKRMDWLSKEVLEWKATAEGYKNKYEELKAQKEADDKKCEEVCAACNERYEDVLAERNRLRSEVALLTAERNTSVSENSELIFTINELQDKWEAEHNLRVEAEKAYDRVTSEAYDMHQQITNLTIENTRLENKVEELSELEADYDALAQTKREYGEEIDRLRKVVIELQTNRFTTDEFIGMIMKHFMPSADK